MFLKKKQPSSFCSATRHVTQWQDPRLSDAFLNKYGKTSSQLFLFFSFFPFLFS